MIWPNQRLLDLLGAAKEIVGDDDVGWEIPNDLQETLVLRPHWVCAVKRRRFPVGASPTRRPLQPEATGAGMEVTKCLKPSDSGSRNTVTARVCRPQRE